MTRTPGIPIRITEQIFEVCRQIDQSQTPYYVSVKPDPESQRDECFFNVKSKVEKAGGQIEFGWAIWEWPNLMVWADFHAIWISPEDERIDITPTPGFEKILFLPDSKRTYDYNCSYYRVPLRYFPVSNDPLVAELITVKQQLFDIEEEHSSGREVILEGHALGRREELKQKEILISLEIMLQSQPPPDYTKPGRNDPCSCGSGRKFKKCCGK
ncbi:MAG TPA: SEC-C metal-binding domain-containing protein [Sedimentisphaerales bacterium]|nr:SEC-C metal-binding domain-containing protein [Sedimentisphaerales bacterium]